MSPIISTWGPNTDAEYADERHPDRIYVSQMFRYPFAYSRDYRAPSRWVNSVFDELEISPEDEAQLAGSSDDADSDLPDPSELGGTPHVIYETARTQVRLWVVRNTGRIKTLRVEKLTKKGGKVEIAKVLELTGDNCDRLIDLLRVAGHIDPEGSGGDGFRIDRGLVDRLQEQPDLLPDVYEANPEVFRELLRNDVRAEDVVAVQHRRRVVDEFRRLMTDDEYFAEVSEAATTRGDEPVWQTFFEANPWILGASLSSQILTSWDRDKLEQVVAGQYGNSRSKRVDALLETSGTIGSLVFAEIKTHKTDLLGKQYRGECWAPSEHLNGGVAQIQGTVQRALYDLRERLDSTDRYGNSIPGEYSYLVRPRSYLLIGQTSEFCGSSGGHNLTKVRSFELYRRHLQEPEVITFDELLARAEWNVAAAAVEEG